MCLLYSLWFPSQSPMVIHGSKSVASKFSWNGTNESWLSLFQYKFYHQTSNLNWWTFIIVFYSKIKSLFGKCILSTYYISSNEIILCTTHSNGMHMHKFTVHKELILSLMSTYNSIHHIVNVVSQLIYDFFIVLQESSFIASSFSKVLKIHIYIIKINPLLWFINCKLSRTIGCVLLVSYAVWHICNISILFQVEDSVSWIYSRHHNSWLLILFMG